MAPSFHKHVVLLFLFQERIAVVGGGDKCLLDAACADPTVEVEGTTRLVVGSGGAGSAEGLAADHRSGGLVVDVEVSGGMTERLFCHFDGIAVGGEDGACQCVG